ncbi:hypothetical protein R9C00_03910 [Flammeovirgaceae bacterium SG7u.111]|nr:hypothetical protein [Flammeovirgaceae bacterium SG7u.132]WPO36591.1 hypothetical protein R9C00_03910 [Flammeovirgaceae bacterium SG7u.111]
MKDNTAKTAIYILIIGVLFIAIAPILFTRTWGLIKFSGTGEIGDTIGGITAPIASVIGSILVFLALRAQIKANEYIIEQNKLQKDLFDTETEKFQLEQKRLKEDKIEENKQKKAQYLFLQYNFLVSEFNDFKYAKGDRNSAFYRELTGYYAILEFVEKELQVIPYTEDDCKIEYAKTDFRREPQKLLLLRILTLVSDYIDLIFQRDLNDLDLQLAENQIQFLFHNKIKPCFEMVKAKIERDPICDKCNKIHGDIPNIFSEKIEEIDNKLNSRLSETKIRYNSRKFMLNQIPPEK